MNISAELSLYPLATSEYKAVITRFIEKLRGYEGLEVQSNTLSTQIFGPYHQVMSAITHELEWVYQQVPTQVLVCKFISKDLRP